MAVNQRSYKTENGVAIGMNRTKAEIRGRRTANNGVVLRVRWTVIDVFCTNEVENVTRDERMGDRLRYERGKRTNWEQCGDDDDDGDG